MVQDLDRKKKKRNRRIFLLILISLIGLSAIQIMIQQLRFPTFAAGNILIFALILHINLILFLVLILLVLRSLFKIYIERKNRVIGARFRTRLVAAFVGLSILPAVILFLVASNFITMSIESWFGEQAEKMKSNSMEVARAYYQVTEGKTLSLAKELGRRIEAEGLLESVDHSRLRELVMYWQNEHQLSQLFINNHRTVEVAASQDGKIHRVPTSKWVRRALKGEESSECEQIGENDVIRAAVPIHSQKDPGRVIGSVVACQVLPFSVSQKENEITDAFKKYHEQKMIKTPFKSVYWLIFLTITLLVTFSAIWAAIHIARRITVPIQLLAEGTRAVAAGNLGYQVEVAADDEIGMLVDSFNQMTRDLDRSKVDLETAYEYLRRTKMESDQRRIYMETVLENIRAGVLSLDEKGCINTVNKTALNILELDSNEVFQRSYEEVFARGDLRPMGVLVKRMAAEGLETWGQQVTLNSKGRITTLFVSVSGLRDEEERHQGMVMVFDDLTELIKAQQAMAWREVARSIAHEIKNPLTPIQLSAQRLRKKFLEKASDFDRVVAESTDTIIQEVEGLKELVSEFSRYARMPSSELKPDDLNQVVNRVLQLFSGLAKRSVIRRALDPNLPLVSLDAAQIRRALINLVDNAIAAVRAGGAIEISTRYSPATSAVYLEVSDTGSGIAPEDKDRLFLPYFSTKKGGTGLGLAIVHRIISEHSGHIRVEDNHPQGTRIVVELPVREVALVAKGIERKVSG